MPRKASPVKSTGATVTPITAATGGKPPMTFTAVPVADNDLPATARKGGRQSNLPAIRSFLESIEPGSWYQMISADDDKGHPVNRVTQIRKLIKEEGGFDMRTDPIASGKRYQVYVRVAQ